PVAVRVSAAKPAQLTGLADSAVQMTVTVGASDGPVLAVPVAAVFTSADGQAKVRVLRPDGSADPVPVTLGLAASGYVEVKLGAGATLAEGDRVVVQG
ncbi:MAG: Tat pathway signal protein, partial [Catenulispora sp.]|nr:Tat pathway signal protein [Catenulispora sp.]